MSRREVPGSFPGSLSDDEHTQRQMPPGAQQDPRSDTRAPTLDPQAPDTEQIFITDSPVLVSQATLDEIIEWQRARREEQRSLARAHKRSKEINSAPTRTIILDPTPLMTLARIARSAGAFLQGKKDVCGHWEMKVNFVEPMGIHRKRDQVYNAVSRNAQSTYSWLSESRLVLTRVVVRHYNTGLCVDKYHDRSIPTQFFGSATPSRSSSRKSTSSTRPSIPGSSSRVDTPSAPNGIPTEAKGETEIRHDGKKYRELWQLRDISRQQIPEEAVGAIGYQSSIAWSSRYRLRWQVPNEAHKRTDSEIIALAFDTTEAGDIPRTGLALPKWCWSETYATIVWSRE